MRRSGLFLSLLAALAAAPPASAQLGERFRFGYDAAPGQVVITFQARAATRGTTVNLARLLGERPRVLDSMPRIDGIVIEMPAERRGAGAAASLQRLRADPAVRRAEPNYRDLYTKVTITMIVGSVPYPSISSPTRNSVRAFLLRVPLVSPARFGFLRAH